MPLAFVTSRIGLGLAALGRPAYIDIGHPQDLAGETDVDSMRARAHAMLDAAYAAGVRYFDAARSYGRAEEFLRSWLTARGLATEDVGVGSKWGYTYTADWRVDAATGQLGGYGRVSYKAGIGTEGQRAHIESRAGLPVLLGWYVDEVRPRCLRRRQLDQADLRADDRRVAVAVQEMNR